MLVKPPGPFINGLDHNRHSCDLAGLRPGAVLTPAFRVSPQIAAKDDRR